MLFRLIVIIQIIVTINDREIIAIIEVVTLATTRVQFEIIVCTFIGLVVVSAHKTCEQISQKDPQKMYV